ncbi:hypothetical protein T12_14783 [Trichinella patagoniensis]|uniref:DNA-directed RNA polymerase III subunit n=1 Tax=Trichinella patagoniensis TaxID=990121 RepID=A0A0V1A6K1_9BILA|nr:hypothetical protein T12_14783 [Trichinella patagoniensis]
MGRRKIPELSVGRMLCNEFRITEDELNKYAKKLDDSNFPSLKHKPLPITLSSSNAYMAFRIEQIRQTIRSNAEAEIYYNSTLKSKNDDGQNENGFGLGRTLPAYDELFPNELISEENKAPFKYRAKNEPYYIESADLKVDEIEEKKFVVDAEDKKDPENPTVEDGSDSEDMADEEEPEDHDYVNSYFDNGEDYLDESEEDEDQIFM